MRRSKQQIIFQILDVCQEGASRTRIVNRANMNNKSAKPYIDMLMTRDLLKLKSNSPALYMTTNKGTQLLHALKMIGSELEWT